jgi:hypothetical protein
MTPGRLALGAALGMLLTGLAVYVLTAPTVRQPVVAPSPEASTPIQDAPGDSTAERDELAELEREIERLRALLDASTTADASQDASVSHDGGAETSVRVRAPAPPVLPASPFCSRPLPDHVIRALFAQVPALREAPPEKLAAMIELMRRGSPECTCSPNPSELAICADWCKAKGFPISRCVVGKCQCSQ